MKKERSVSVATAVGSVLLILLVVVPELEPVFADSGAKPPPGMGTSTPQEVAAGVIKAIERNKVEIAVAPVQTRALAHLGLARPRIAMRAVSGGTASKTADRVAEGQGDKR